MFTNTGSVRSLNFVKCRGYIHTLGLGRLSSPVEFVLLSWVLTSPTTIRRGTRYLLIFSATIHLFKIVKTSSLISAVYCILLQLIGVGNKRLPRWKFMKYWLRSNKNNIYILPILCGTHRVDIVLGLFSSHPNWDPHLSSTGECVPPFGSGRGQTRLRERGPGGSPNSDVLCGETSWIMFVSYWKFPTGSVGNGMKCTRMKKRVNHRIYWINHFVHL